MLKKPTLKINYWFLFSLLGINMQYTDHPEYPKYKDMIDSILADGYPLTKEVSGNVFDTCPQLLEERFFKAIHHPYKELIGQKKHKLTALGFVKQKNISSSKAEMIYQCDCQRYMTAKPTMFEKDHNAVLCCPYCNAMAESFNTEFHKRHGHYLNSEVVRSISGLHIGSELTEFVASARIKRERQLSDEGLLLSEQNIKTLTALIHNDNPNLNRLFFKAPTDQAEIVYIARNHSLRNAFRKPKDILDLTLLTDVPHQLKEAAGKRIFRLTVLGIYQNFKPLKMSNISYVCQCDCGCYTNVTHSALKADHLPICSRCYQVVQAFQNLMKKNDQEFTDKEALEAFGFDTSLAPAQIEDLKTIKTNAYDFKKKVYEPETTSQSYHINIGKRFGFATVTSKSRQFNDGTKRTPYVCECICGRDCIVSYEQVYRQRDNLYIACSACASTVQKVLGFTMALGQPKSFVDKQWVKFLEFNGISARNVDLYSTYKKWLELKAENPALILEDTITQIVKELATAKQA